MVLHSLCWDGFDEPLATPDDGFTALAKGLVVALEVAIVQVDKILESGCRDLFFTAATSVFSHVHLREPVFDFSSMILPVPANAHDRAAEAVKGPVEALVRRYSCVAAPSSPGAAEADDGEDDACDVNDQPPAEGPSGDGSS
ncbi:hypothetical protein ZWY2020_057602 [Hordeum vulgare]|nr:hypothetical protein ZWY2020_057602 [Hordeum vulgare]